MFIFPSNSFELFTFTAVQNDRIPEDGFILLFCLDKFLYYYRQTIIYDNRKKIVNTRTLMNTIHPLFILFCYFLCGANVYQIIIQYTQYISIIYFHVFPNWQMVIYLFLSILRYDNFSENHTLYYIIFVSWVRYLVFKR